jgi:hypothetical protein
VIINNVAALEILLDCGYVRAALLAAVGAVCRAGVGWVSPSSCSLIFSFKDRCGYLGDPQLTCFTVHSTRGGSGWWCCCCWGGGDWRCDRALVEVCGECWLGLSRMQNVKSRLYTTYQTITRANLDHAVYGSPSVSSHIESRPSRMMMGTHRTRVHFHKHFVLLCIPKVHIFTPPQQSHRKLKSSLQPPLFHPSKKVPHNTQSNSHVPMNPYV